MYAQSGFDGFPKAMFAFYQQLAANNNRPWFQAHRAIHREEVLAPAVAFVQAMGPRLKSFAPDIIADPRTDGAGSIFRIHRDGRLGKQTNPYKTHLGIHFSVGGRTADSPGFYMHVQPGRLVLAAGHFRMGKEALARYRDAVLNEKHGSDLAQVVKSALTSGGWKLGGRHYKRVPRGLDPAHARAEYLLHKGLYVYEQEKLPREIFGPDGIDYVASRFKEMLPVYTWLRMAMP